MRGMELKGCSFARVWAASDRRLLGRVFSAWVRLSRHQQAGPCLPNRLSSIRRTPGLGILKPESQIPYPKFPAHIRPIQNLPNLSDWWPSQRHLRQRSRDDHVCSGRKAGLAGSIVSSKERMTWSGSRGQRCSKRTTQES